jgi:hypothetical protein
MKVGSLLSMFAHFNHLVNSSDDDEPLVVTAEEPTSLDARHDAALLRDAVVKFSMKMLPGGQKGPACTFKLVGHDGWYPPNWPLERRVAPDVLNRIIASFQLVEKAAVDGRVKPKYLQEDIWHPSDQAAPIIHAAYVLPCELLDDLLQSMSYTCGAKPCFMHSRKNFVEYSCPHSRASRAGVESKTDRKLDNRAKCTNCHVSYRKVPLGAPFDAFVVFYQLQNHNHAPENEELMRTHRVDQRIFDFILSNAKRGLSAGQIHSLLLISALNGTHSSGAGAVVFNDARLFPTYESIYKIMKRKQLGTTGNDPSRVDDFALRNPANVTIMSRFAKTEDGKGIASHLKMRIGSPVTEENIKRYMPGGLVCLDATHGMNDYAYQVFTAMAIDLHTMQPRLLEHFVTSSPSSEVVAEWLKSLSDRAGGVPLEVIEDKCRTQTPAIEQAWPTAHIHLCWFHTMKTFRDEFSGVTKEKKQLLLSWLRKIYYSRNAEMLLTNVSAFESFLQVHKLDKFLEYWKANWASCLPRWVRCHAVFKFVGTNNFLESFHRTLKHGHSGGGSKRIVSLFDCVQILLQMHFFNNHKIVEQACNRSYAVAHLKRLRKTLQMKSLEMRQSGKYLVYKDVVEAPESVFYIAKHSDDGPEDDPEIEEVYDVRITPRGSFCTCSAYRDHEAALCKHIAFCAEESRQLDLMLFQPKPSDNLELLMHEMRRWASSQKEKVGDSSLCTDIFATLNAHFDTLRATDASDDVTGVLDTPSVEPNASLEGTFGNMTTLGVDDDIRKVRQVLKKIEGSLSRIDTTVLDSRAHLQALLAHLMQVEQDNCPPAAILKPVGGTAYGPVRPDDKRRFERTQQKSGPKAVHPMDASMSLKNSTLTEADMTSAWNHREREEELASGKGARKRARKEELTVFSQTIATASQHSIPVGPVWTFHEHVMS